MSVEYYIGEVLKLLGRDIKSEGLQRTPERVAEVLKKMSSGYQMEVKLERQYTEHSDLIVARDIKFISFCEHHLLPFFGTVDIAYIPKGRVVGLSKLDQLVEKYAYRFTIQERMGAEIADELEKAIEAFGVMVVVRATHTCKAVEGYDFGEYVTSHLRGVFLWNPSAKSEVLQIIGR